MKCYTLKTIILGDSGVGKTTMLYKYYTGVFNNERDSTVGVNFVSKYLEETTYDDFIKLQIWDTAGQERFRSIIRSYYHSVCGCIITYDITNKASFDNCIFWIEEVRKYNKNVKIVLVGTKTDLEEKRKIKYDEGLKLSNYYKMPFFEISSKDCVDEVFEKVVELVMEHLKEDEINEVQSDIKGVVELDNFDMYKYKYDNSINKSFSSYILCCNN